MNCIQERGGIASLADVHFKRDFSPQGTEVTDMEVFWWILTGGLVVVGFVGTALPFVPGTLLLWLGVVLHFFLLPGGLGWGSLLGITFLMLLSQVVDILSGAAGAKWFGATRWGVLGGILGAVIGIFFGLLGLILGPIIGALLGELLAGRGLVPAGKSSFGTVLGAAAGLVLKLLLAFLMAAWFAWAVLF
jgi:uncharacterized protein YqgC (DUF456 family)